MEGSNSSGGESVDLYLKNYKLGKTLCNWSFGKVKFAEHVLTGHKVSIYIINCRWTKNIQMEEKGMYPLHINDF